MNGSGFLSRGLETLLSGLTGFCYFWHSYAPWIVFFVGVAVFAYVEITDRKSGASKDSSALPAKETNTKEEKPVRNYIEPGAFSQIAENYRRLKAEKEREKEANGEIVESYPTWEERELELLEHLAKERGESKKYL